MSLNIKQTTEQAAMASARLLKEKGYISAIDVLIEVGRLSMEDYQNWRCGKIPYLEKVITGNLNKINTTLRAIQAYSRKEQLKPSKTVYRSYSKGAKKLLRFSKSGDQRLEEAYAAHFVKTKQQPE